MGYTVINLLKEWATKMNNWINELIREAQSVSENLGKVADNLWLLIPEIRTIISLQTLLFVLQVFMILAQFFALREVRKLREQPNKGDSRDNGGDDAPQNPRIIEE